MACFYYRNGKLHIEEIALADIAEKTPFYIYSAARLRENYRNFAAAFGDLPLQVHYAVKACANRAVMRVLADCGAGADIVSGGEMTRALDAGISAEKIVFSGVGKTESEIEAALCAGLYQINVESLPELAEIGKKAALLNRTAAVALRLNPDVTADTHAKMSTGHKEAKFGIDMSQLPEAMERIEKNPRLAFKGFAVHIGSHLGDYESLRRGLQRVAEAVHTWRNDGFKIERLDCGGGVPIPYDGEVENGELAAYAAVVRETVGNLGCKLSFEPGRYLVGDACLILAKVLYVKDLPFKRFVIIDAAMNDLVRPAMYGARHGVLPVRENASGKTRKADLVGPACESSDCFGEDYDLPEDIKSGDFIAILQAGAYGSTMGGTYNGRALAPELIVDGKKWAVSRRRISVAEQIGWETVPTWI